MTETAGSGPTRTEELRALAEAYLRDDEIATYCTVLPKVRELAARLGNEESLNAFVTMVKVVYNGSGRVQPAWAEVRDYLADLKRAIKRVLRMRSREPGTARIENIEQMLDSGSARMAIVGMLMRQRRGRIWFDDFFNVIRTDWKCDRSDVVVEPYTLGDEAMHNIMMWAMAQDIETLGAVSMTNINEAVFYIANLDHRDALLDYVGGFPLWDGTQRLDTVMQKAFGCQVDDDAGQTEDYLKACGRNTFISLIARAKEPGCQADFMPIFMGAQGTYKSTAMRIIGAKFHGEIHESLNSNDFYLGLQGVWVAEVAELASIVSGKVETAKAKAMLSRQRDKIRPPYARTHREYLRRNIFAGTSNPGSVGALRDETGNRRYGPLMCGVIDTDWLIENRTQLLAEAVVEYERGADWWKMPEAAHRLAVQRHQVTSVHEDTIRQYLLAEDLHDGTSNGPAIIPPDRDAAFDDPARWGNVVTPKRVIMQWLRVSEDRASSLFMEVSAALIRLGWEDKETSIRVGGRKVTVKRWRVVDPTSRSEARNRGDLTVPAVFNRASNMDIPF